MFDLKATHEFYTEILGCRVIVETDTLLEMDFFGNRIVLSCVWIGDELEGLA